ncbi:aldose 1-epimerase [Marinomonas sp. 2405UD68-3]|uniref:aldose 1-epimerase n=1 Tax=Marinomonas sp. 2405UD68-3 TaxID=3391835 RepID=UPI0039C8C1CB
MSNSTLLILKNASFEVGVCPKNGGVITHFTSPHRGEKIDWFRAINIAELNNPIDALNAASFPLFPFSNRIANNMLSIGGEDYKLSSNVEGWPQIIHGHSWLGKWHVTHHSDTVITLTFKFPNTSVECCGWPYSYEAEQKFELSDTGLNIQLKLLNTSDKVMPAGMGIHPYFCTEPNMQVSLNTTGQWFGDELNIPHTHESETVAVLSFREGELTKELDHNFTGWDGVANIHWPSHGGTLQIKASDLFRNAVVYSPKEESYFCLEPVTHTTNAFNQSDLSDVLGGTQMLAPSESIQGDIQFTPQNFE